MRLRFALLAANALDANIRANPMTKVFDTVANFISCSFFFPELFGIG